jgi:beta-lactamase regulating signal transducer with metallopeptidase domain
VRHASWTSVLFAMLLMPVLLFCVPAIGVPFSMSVRPLPGGAGIGTLGDSQTTNEVARDPDRTASVDPIAGRADESATAETEAGAHLSESINHPSQASPWLLAVLTVYYSVAAAMLLRFLLGWCGAARMTRASERVSPPSECLAFMRSGEEQDIRESRMVVAPVTVGVLVPTILLPVTWRHWSREKLRAVLAHEVAHIRRRDLLIAFIAHLNSCLLWFHPLSWWLERTLAATAEQASDDIALSVVGARATYVEILLDMAREVSQGRGRISWLGVGIDGSGSLNQRINRVLSAEVVREMSTVRTAVLALSCISAILLGAACGPSSASLLTLPVLIAFSVLLSAVIELRGAPFFRWIHDVDQ